MSNYKEAIVTYLEEPYHQGFHWQVDFGGKAKQWYKTEEEARSVAEDWDNFITHV